VKDQTSFEQLTDTVSALRGENGCPWDKRQTRETLRPYVLEEAYEVLDAIDAHDVRALREELGDLLLQVLFHAQLASEEDTFTIENVVADLNAKLIRRHPHVFDGGSAATEQEVSHQWEEIKKREKATQSDQSALHGVPATMPALFRAFKLQKRAAKTGFDWTDIADVWTKLDEEITELRQAQTQQENINPRETLDLAQQRVEEELGDVLFTVVNLSRFLAVNPELALKGANDRFVARFCHMEQAADTSGIEMKHMTLDDLDLLWNRAKQALANTQKEVL
jgi:tetrapyrrole methylase family protein/MazG family protein